MNRYVTGPEGRVEQRMRTQRGPRGAAWVVAGVVGLAVGAPARAQSSAERDDAKPRPAPTAQPAPSPARKTRPVRKAVIDLEAQAKDRRPGQVMPGDPAPFSPAPAAPAKGAPTPAPERPIDLPADIASPTPASAPTTGAVRPAPIPPAPGQPFSSRAVGADGQPAPAEPAAATPAPAEAPAAAPAPTPPPAPAPEPARPAEPAPAAKPEASAVPLVDPLVISNLPAPAQTGPAKVRVVSVGSTAVQWKAGDAAWKSPAAGDEADARVEVRAGLDADLVLLVDDAVEVRVSRLGRATIERGGDLPMVTLTRGAVEIKPARGEGTPGQALARVKTPDGSFGVAGGLRVEYDAFSGTRRRALGS